jgi:hypothetical protein
MCVFAALTVSTASMMSKARWPERPGLHHRRAAEWVRVAGGTYADYVAVVTHAPAANAAT